MKRYSFQRPEQAGFGNCQNCAFLETGTAEICYNCAYQTFEHLPKRKCRYCSHPLEPKEKCGNPVCTWPDKYFDRCHAIAMRSGELKKAINDYKYNNKKQWSLVFGRVLAGYLIKNKAKLKKFDLIVGSPTYVSSDARRTWDHIRMILEKTAEQFETNEWPFDLKEKPAIIQTSETPAFPGKSWKERYDIATTILRESLEIPSRKKTRGRRILVFDDVFTDGLRLNEVARALKEQGSATKVSGLVLARQPFGG